MTAELDPTEELCGEITCHWFGYSHPEHPCGWISAKEGEPCELCGVVVVGESCSACWTPFTDEEVRNGVDL